MEKIAFDRRAGKWAGGCPRCARNSFFETRSSFTTGSGVNVDTLYCPGGHAVFVEYTDRPNGDKYVVSCLPVEYVGKVPLWLPEKYQSTYRELLEAKIRGLKRSVVALCGVLLEAYVNELIKNPGEKKLSLFKRLELLYDKDLIDKDQFSNGTITRITRNEILHPEEILQDITNEEVELAFEEVTGFFERSFRWRSSKALPPPEPTETETKTK